MHCVAQYPTPARPPGTEPDRPAAIALPRRSNRLLHARSTRTRRNPCRWRLPKAPPCSRSMSACLPKTHRSERLLRFSGAGEALARKRAARIPYLRCTGQPDGFRRPKNWRVCARLRRGSLPPRPSARARSSIGPNRHLPRHSRPARPDHRQRSVQVCKPSSSDETSRPATRSCSRKSARPITAETIHAIIQRINSMIQRDGRDRTGPGGIGDLPSLRSRRALRKWEPPSSIW